MTANTARKPSPWPGPAIPPGKIRVGLLAPCLEQGGAGIRRCAAAVQLRSNLARVAAMNRGQQRIR